MPVKINFGAGKKNTWLSGFINLDLRYGWKMQDGFKNYEDNSAECLSGSHCLMYLTLEELDIFLKECYRVLKPKGIVRITEDNCEDPKSDTFQKGWKNEAKCLTGPEMMRDHLEKAGFKVYDVAENETYYKDRSLMQSFHTNDNPNRVFFIEGIKL